MLTASKILSIARAEIGVTEYPAGSNKVKYNTWFYGKEVSGSSYPWCMAFVQWVFNQAGHKLSPLTASCNSLFLQSNMQRVYSDYKPGDIVFFNFDGNPDADHVGIVESYTNGVLVSIEGNTSATSQDNGGAVMRRSDHGQYVIYALRPSYSEDYSEGINTAESTENSAQAFLDSFKAYRSTLQDNNAGNWSLEAREWAVNTGLIEGGGTLPDGTANYMWQDFLTREQMAMLLYRFARMMGKA